jgi:hypothetical protein
MTNLRSTVRVRDYLEGMWKHKITNRWRKYASMSDDQDSHGPLEFIDEHRPMRREKMISSSSLGTSATVLEDLSHGSSHVTRMQASINEDDDTSLPPIRDYGDSSQRQICQIHENLENSDVPQDLQTSHDSQSFDDDYHIEESAFTDSPYADETESNDKVPSKESACEVTWNRAKMVHLLSCKSLRIAAEIGDEGNWKSTRGDDLSVIYSVGTYETQESSKRIDIQKGDESDTNDQDNFLAKQLEQLPSAKLADLVLELERKLKKAKKKKKEKKKKKKSSSSKSKRRSSKANFDDIKNSVSLNKSNTSMESNFFEDSSNGGIGDSMGSIMFQQEEECCYLSTKSDDEMAARTSRSSKSSRRKSLPELEMLSLRDRGDFPCRTDDLQFRSLDLTPWGHLGFDDTSSEEEDE